MTTKSDSIATISKDDLRSQIRHLQLTCRITQRSEGVMSCGAFADVFRGRCQIDSRKDVAVAMKRLRICTDDDEESNLLFFREIYVWSKLKHENVLKLLGFLHCHDTGYPMLISEWMDHGTAWQYVSKNADLSLADIKLLIIDIARGLNYLHLEGVVHSDIKGDNVVISSRKRALICDLGSARMVTYSRSIAKLTKARLGTVPYWSPEIVLEESGPSFKADVYAFGMTAFELATREKPYSQLHEVHIIRRLLEEKTPEFPPSFIDSQKFPRKICDLCWTRDPAKRPDMRAILQGLEWFKDETLCDESDNQPTIMVQPAMQQHVPPIDAGPAPGPWAHLNSSIHRPPSRAHISFSEPPAANVTTLFFSNNSSLRELQDERRQAKHSSPNIPTEEQLDVMVSQFNSPAIVHEALGQSDSKSAPKLYTDEDEPGEPVSPSVSVAETPEDFLEEEFDRTIDPLPAFLGPSRLVNLQPPASPSELFRYYCKIIIPMQLAFDNNELIELLRRCCSDHRLLRNAIGIAALYDQYRKRCIRRSANVSLTNTFYGGRFNDDASARGIIKKFSKRAQEELAKFTILTTAAACTQTNKSGVFCMRKADALTSVLHISFSARFDGSFGADAFLNIAYQWLDQVVTKANKIATKSKGELWECLAEKAVGLKGVLIRKVMWFDVVASIAQCRKPRFFDAYLSVFGPLLVHESDHKLRREREALRDSQISMLEVVGCDNNTFLAFAEIAALSAWKAEQDGENSSFAMNLVRQEIKIEKTYLSGTVCASNDYQTNERTYTSAIFYSAAKLYLHTIFRGNEPRVPGIASGVRNIIEALGKVPTHMPTLRSRVIRAVLLPICLAGCLAETVHSTWGSIRSHSASSSLFVSPSAYTTTTGGKRKSGSGKGLTDMRPLHSSLDNASKLQIILEEEMASTTECADVLDLLKKVWAHRDVEMDEYGQETFGRQRKRVRIGGSETFSTSSSSNSRFIVRGSTRGNPNFIVQGRENSHWQSVLKERGTVLLVL